MTLLTRLAQELLSAREKKGLSQRQVSERSGVTQNRLSRIENGTIDLRLSSLGELAHSLDLEVVLVPREALPAVRSLVAGASGTRFGRPTVSQTHKAITAALKSLERLKGRQRSGKLFAQIHSALKDLTRFPVADDEAYGVKKETDIFINHLNDGDQDPRVLNAATTITQLRNVIAHKEPARPDPVRPAYGFGDEEDG